ncbi:MAG: hypothetical protein RLZZ115_1675, partial [Cyanobacteriota bacterium]
AAVTGEPCEINAFHSLAYLMGAKPETPTDAISAINREQGTGNSEQDEPEGVEPPEEPQAIEEPVIDSVPVSPPDEMPIPVTTVAEPMNAPPPVTISRDSTYKIETIRVPTRNLDGLMTQTGELTVTKIRIAHRLNEIEDLVSLLRK